MVRQPAFCQVHAEMCSETDLVTGVHSTREVFYRLTASPLQYPRLRYSRIRLWRAFSTPGPNSNRWKDAFLRTY